MRTPILTLSLPFALSLLGAVGCTSAAPPAVAPDAKHAPEPADDPSQVGYESAIGGLPEEAMNRAFTSFAKDVERCVQDGSSHLEALGGHVKIALKVDTSGVAKDVWVSESALGDRATEKCIVDAAKARSWPHAVGGDGLASTSFDATPARDRASWDERKVRGVVAQVRASALKCRRGIGGDFVVTAYVKPDGRVESAGLAMTSAEGDQAADCIVGVVKKTRFGLPGRASKLSFTL